MKAIARYLVLFGMILLLQACADMFNSSSSPSSANEQPTATAPSETYFDQFSDVPIPSEMSVDRKRSLSTTTQDGMRIGLITVTGRVDILSLNNAMIHNMARNGWALRAATTGPKTLQIYEKGMQYCIIYTYEDTFNTVMEIWGAQRLGENAYPAATATPDAASSFVLEPTTPAPAEEAPVF